MSIECNSLCRPTTAHPHIAQHFGVVLVGILTEAIEAACRYFIVVYQGIVQCQRLQGSIAGLLPITMEQVDQRQQTIAISLVRVVDVDGMFLQQGYCGLQFANDEVIDLRHCRLGRYSLQIVMLHDADATVLSSRSWCVRLGIEVDGNEVVPGTQHTSLSLCQRLQVSITRCLLDVVYDQILAHNIRIDIGIEVVVGYDGTLSLFVKSEVNAVKRAVFVAENIRLLGPRIVAQHIKRCHIIAALRNDYQLIVLRYGVYGNGSLGRDINITVTGSERYASE